MAVLEKLLRSFALFSFRIKEKNWFKHDKLFEKPFYVKYKIKMQTTPCLQWKTDYKELKM